MTTATQMPPVDFDYGEFKVIQGGEELNTAKPRYQFRHLLEDITIENFTLARAFTAMLAAPDIDWGGLTGSFLHHLKLLQSHLNTLYPDYSDIPKSLGETSITFLGDIVNFFEKIAPLEFQEKIELELHESAIRDYHNQNKPGSFQL